MPDDIDKAFTRGSRNGLQTGRQSLCARLAAKLLRLIWICSLVIVAAQLCQGNESPAQAKSRGQAQPKKQHQAIAAKRPRGSNTADASEDNTGTDGSKSQAAGASHIRIVYPPNDLAVGTACESRIAPLIFTTTEKSLKDLTLAGSLQDKDSQRTMPASAFDLWKVVPNQSLCSRTGLEDVANTSSPVQAQIHLKEDWTTPGNFSGYFLLLLPGDAEPQTVKMKVSVRSGHGWLTGTLAILAGALLWWFATIWIAHMRQQAGSQILVSRLKTLLDNLTEQLEAWVKQGIPKAAGTLAHINEILKTKLPEVIADKELAVIAGVIVPATGSVTVTDEIQGVNDVVQLGFQGLIDLWNQNPESLPTLKPFFEQMDELGGTAQPLSIVDQRISTILAHAKGALPPARVQAMAAAPTELQALPQESVIVHRVLFSTYLLDIVSVLTVVTLGVYALICKNPGFGSPADLLVAFFWGLGLKLGTDASKLGPGDVRTAYNIKIPSA